MLLIYIFIRQHVSRLAGFKNATCDQLRLLSQQPKTKSTPIHRSQRGPAINLATSHVDIEHKQFNLDGGTGERMREAIKILDSSERNFLYEGEMNIDTALDSELRTKILPDNRLIGDANVLIFALSLIHI